jgi:hypothetical protein
MSNSGIQLNWEINVIPNAAGAAIKVADRKAGRLDAAGRVQHQDPRQCRCFGQPALLLTTVNRRKLLKNTTTFGGRFTLGFAGVTRLLC